MLCSYEHVLQLKVLKGYDYYFIVDIYRVAGFHDAPVELSFNGMNGMYP